MTQLLLARLLRGQIYLVLVLDDEKGDSGWRTWVVLRDAAGTLRVWSSHLPARDANLDLLLNQLAGAVEDANLKGERGMQYVFADGWDAWGIGIPTQLASAAPVGRMDNGDPLDDWRSAV